MRLADKVIIAEIVSKILSRKDLSVTIRNPAFGEIIRGHLKLDLVPREDTDVVLPHLPGNMGQHDVVIVQLNPEHRVR